MDAYEKLRIKSPHKNTRTYNVENSTGELLKNTKNVFDCYQCI
jgi:hypothetical protein